MYASSNGETDLLVWDHEVKCLKQPPVRRQNEHEGEVISISAFKDSYFLTTGIDGWMRVWNADKEICSELHFPDPVHYACLLSEAGDVLVSHGAGGYTIIKGAEYNFKLFKGKGFTLDDCEQFRPKRR